MKCLKKDRTTDAGFSQCDTIGRSRARPYEGAEQDHSKEQSRFPYILTYICVFICIYALLLPMVLLCSFLWSCSAPSYGIALGKSRVCCAARFFYFKKIAIYTRTGLILLVFLFQNVNLDN